VFVIPSGFSENKILDALSGVGFSCQKTKSIKYVDVYFDIQSGRLFRSQIWLRKRNKNLWQLLEKEILILQQPANESDTLPSKEILEKISPIAKTPNLIPHIKIKVIEEPYILKRGEKEETTISFQKLFYSHPFKVIWITGPYIITISAEASQISSVQYLTSLLRDFIGLQSESFNLLVDGLNSLNLPLPGAPIPENLIIKSGDNFFQAGEKILSRQAYKMWANIEGTIRQLDPEFLHDLRVATRRARFALKLFSSIVSPEPCEKLRKELGWIARTLGKVRDLDVFLQNLKGQFKKIETAQEVEQYLLENLGSQRKTDLKKLVAALKSKRYGRILNHLRNFFSTPEVSQINQDQVLSETVYLASEFIKKAGTKIQKFVKSKNETFSAEEIHKIRIAFKGLRYTCEFFSDLLGEPVKKMIDSFVEFQDCLGSHQDAVVAMKNLHDIIQSRYADGEASLNETLTIGALIQVNKEMILNERNNFMKLWRKMPEIFQQIDNLKSAEVGMQNAFAQGSSL